MSSANPRPAAARRTSSAAPGTYGTRAPGRTMLSTGPMSRADAAASYRASQPLPCSWAMIRGATAPTAGSAKWRSNGASQPGPGTQSESTKATSGVRTAARPVFRAAPAPPHRSRRRQRAPAAAAAAATAARSADPSSTTMIRMPPRPARHRASSAGRSRTGMTAVTSSGPGPAGRVRVGEPGVEQAPRQFLRGGPAGHRHPVPPPAGQRGAARAKAQQAQRRPAHQDGPAGQAEQARIRPQAHPGRHG